MKCYSSLKKNQKTKNNLATKDMSSGNNINYIKNKLTQYKNLIFQHFISPFTM